MLFQKPAKYSKGQWLLISAVVISTVFLVISTTLSSYFGVESSEIAVRDEEYIYNNLADEIESIISSSYPCEEKVTNLENFIAFAVNEYEKQGYLIEILYTSDCPGTEPVLTKLSVKSDTMNIIQE